MHSKQKQNKKKQQQQQQQQASKKQTNKNKAMRTLKSVDPRTDYRQLPLISPGLIQLCKGFRVGL